MRESSIKLHIDGIRYDDKTHIIMLKNFHNKGFTRIQLAKSLFKVFDNLYKLHDTAVKRSSLRIYTIYYSYEDYVWKLDMDIRG